MNSPKLDAALNESLAKISKANLLCEFLECFVHQVICFRGLYDKKLFETRKLYDMYVKRSLHPELNKYIHETTRSLQVFNLNSSRC